MLVVFLAHLARQIRVEWMLREVYADTDITMNKVLTGATRPGITAPVPPPVPEDAVPLCATASGFFTSIDGSTLLAAAIKASAVVRVDRCPGDSLIAGTPIAHTWPFGAAGPMTAADRSDLQACIGDAVDVGFERTSAQDIAFGLRQIVDVTVKALSPGVNDPTTAVHGLGHISALLCTAAGKDLGPKLLRDHDDQVRVVLRRPAFTELLELAVAQPRRYGATDPDVLSRIAVLLREVAWVAGTPEQHHAITGQVERLAATIEGQDFDEVEHLRLQDQLKDTRRALIGRWLPTTAS